MNVFIIGGGNMGLNFAQSFVNAKAIRTEHLYIIEKLPARMAYLQSLNIAHISDDLSLLPKADIIVLAVKPQDSAVLFEEMRPHLHRHQVILSIMAGVTTVSIQAHLQISKIIRAMPNLPSQVGYGMTGFTATDAVSKIELHTIQNLLSTTGKILYLEEESQIDTITAISGSGPAYVYYFMDALMKAAQSMGVTRAASELLVVQTFQGALQLYQQNSLSCSEWMSRVASKGGTTEAALSVFNAEEVHQHIQKGATAALQRAKELG